VKPLRELTRKNSLFEWTSECEDAWLKLKDSLTSDTVMSYFNHKLETELVVDASPHGVGAILTQIQPTKDGRRDVQIVAYASRALDDVESRYSQTEREALAVRWGVEHFHLYLYGIKFTVVTDHKALVSIFSNVVAKPSPRIERWCLRLQQYTFNTVYRPGADNPADYMSRHPVASTSERGRKVTEEYINYVCETVCPKALSHIEVIQATQQDPMLQNVIKCQQTGLWHEFKNCEEMSIYGKLSSELSVTENGILLRGHRIVIPVTMRRKVVQIAHEGHQGLVKTKSLLRAKVWFPYMDKLTEDIVKNCATCAVVTKDERLQPLQMSQLPDKAWESLCADFCGPYPSGDYCLVVLDEYSRFPVVELVRSTSARSVIPVFDQIFATHGMPETLKTDNGPPFQGFEFRKFMQYCGIRHRRITPLWPRSNAQAEHFMKPLNKAIKSATVEGKSWRQEMYKFLRNYRATPHVTTGRPPAELLFGSNIKVLLPELFIRVEDKELRTRDAEQKQQQKQYADARNCVRSNIPLHVGDTVLMKQTKTDKLCPAYNPAPMSVVQVKGSMITANSPVLGSKTRNSSHFRKVTDHDVTPETESTIENSDYSQDVPEIITVNNDELNQDSSHNSNVTDVSAGRPKRRTRMPARYKDFISK
jgi:hypothetical protein